MANPLEALFRQHLASSVFMDSMRASAGGWLPNVHFKGADPREAGGNGLYDPMYFYIVHTGENWISLYQTFRPQTFEITEAVKADEEMYGMVRDALGFVLTEAAHGREVVVGEYSTDQIVGMLACMYAGTTRTYPINAAGFGPGTNFVILGYPTKNTEGKSDLLLRPFAIPPMPGQPGPLSVDQLHEAVEYAIGLDRKNHPEWFNH